MNFIIYTNILELISFQKLKLISEVLNESKLNNQLQQHIVIKTQNDNQKKFFILILTDNNEFYRSPSMLKIYTGIHEIKNPSGNLECITIGTNNNDKFTKTVFPKVSMNNNTANIKHRYISKNIFYINILKHEIISYEFLIIKDRDKLFEELQFNKYNNEWENKLPKILYSDPTSIWLGLEIGDIIYYNGYYRECINE